MPLNVFYLDDEPDLLDIFKDVFQSDKVKVSTFTDPHKLMNETSLNKPDIIFFDYRLPGTTGDEVALKIDNSITKVLITGDLQVDCKTQFLQKLEKPLEFEAVFKILDSFLKPAK